jgi:hypothetical protein
MNACPKTLFAAVRYFADETRCRAQMRRIKWPAGTVTCPNCGGTSTSPVKQRPLIQCNSRSCKKQFGFKVGTIFESSPLPLGHWFVAIWAIATCEHGISSHELARAIGVTQKTAWFVLHRIRLAMQAGSFSGEVEGDETCVAGMRGFDALTRAIVAVPKEDVDRLEAERLKRPLKQ